MNTRRACSLYRFVLPYLSSFTIFAVLASGQFARAAERAITVNVDPGKTKTQNVGCGFNDLSDAVYELTIEVTSQYTIVETGIDEQAGDSVLWQRDANDITKFHIVGVDPNKRFWVVIWAKLLPPGETEGEMIRWMSVSDLDADADTDNNSTACPRIPSASDTEDFAEYPGYQAPPTVPGIVIGVNDDHDEFLPNSDPWGRDLDNTTADLTKEGKNYTGSSVGLAQIKVKVGVKRAPGALAFAIPSAVRFFEGELPTSANKGAAFIGDRTIDSAGEQTFLFYAEGKTPYQEPQQLVISYDPEGPGQGKAQDTVTVLPVQMDLDVDSDNDGAITSSDDPIEAKPQEIGMIVPTSTDPENGKPGILRGLFSQQVTQVLDNVQTNPVIRLGRLSGDGGHVCVWKVRAGQDPILMLDTSQSTSTTTDGDGNTLFQLLGDATDHDILITGVTPGEVLLALELRLNNGTTKVALDVVRVTVIHANLDIARLNGSTVSQLEEHTQGSITSIVEPNEDFDVCTLRLSPAFSPIELLDDSENPNRVRLYLEKVVLPKSPGKIRIIRDGTIWMEDTDVSKELSGADLSHSFSVQGTYGGVIDLMLVAKIGDNAIAADQVRISAIPDAIPQPGRILFVNPGAGKHDPPYDDFLENASSSVALALAAATPGDNIAVARDYDYRFSNRMSLQASSIVLAGLGGRLVPPPSPNPYPWTTNEMDWTQRLPHLDGQETSGIVQASDVNDIQLAGLVFTNASAAEGAGCRFETSSHVSVLSCRFDENVATEGGAGIMFRFTHSSTVSGCIFTGNWQSNAESTLGGGGVLMQSCNGSTVARCRFEGTAFENSNLAQYGGGGICLYTCPSSLVSACYFTACHGNLGGAILVKDPLEQLESRVINCVFVENCPAGSSRGGAICVIDASCSVSGCMFSDNSAMYGGAVACQGTALTDCPYDVNIETSTFARNSAASGGALAVLGAAEGTVDSCDPNAGWGGIRVNIARCGFDGNVATSRGGAIFATSSCSAVTATGPNTVFTGNTVTGGAQGSMRGGAIAGCARSGVYITGTSGAPIVFDGNECDVNGGAIYHTTRGEGVYEHCVFTNNTASGDGGAIHATCGGDVTLTDCIVGTVGNPNRAANGGGISASSAEIRMDGSSVPASAVAYNEASNDGGGVYTIKILDGNEEWWVAFGCGIQNTEFSATKTQIVFNTADGPGGIFGRRSVDELGLAGYTLCLTESLVQGNTMTGGGITDPLVPRDIKPAGLYYQHEHWNLGATIDLQSCTFAQHSSAAITFLGGQIVPTIVGCNVTDNGVGLFTTASAGAYVYHCTFDNNGRAPLKTHVIVRNSDIAADFGLRFEYSSFLSNGTQCGFDIDKSGSEEAFGLSRCNLQGFTGSPQLYGVHLREIEMDSGGNVEELPGWNCYWGAADGPLDDSDDTAVGGDYNPSGSGSHVTDGLEYRPWRTTPVTW